LSTVLTHAAFVLFLEKLVVKKWDVILDDIP